MQVSPLIAKVVKLDLNTNDRLKHLGELKRRSPHWLMQEAIARYLAQEEYNEELNRETLMRWQTEAEQEKVVSHQDVTQWLDTWGTDEESDRP
jgi:predicted transcriptional regulator